MTHNSIHRTEHALERIDWSYRFAVSGDQAIPRAARARDAPLDGDAVAVVAVLIGVNASVEQSNTDHCWVLGAFSNQTSEPRKIHIYIPINKPVI